MKAIGWKGLLALAALLVVPLTATPVSAETGTWFCNAAGGVEIRNIFEVPCDVLNAQAGSPLVLADHVVMSIQLRNVTGVNDLLTRLQIESRNTQPDMIAFMHIYQESGVGVPTGPSDFDSGSDILLGTVNLGADAFWDQNGAGSPAPTAPADFDLTGLSGGGLTLPAFDGTYHPIHLYVVVDFRATILGDPALVNAGVGVALDGDLPSIEIATAGTGPVDDDGPSGTSEIVINTPMLVNRLETRSPMWDFTAAGDLSTNDIQMGIWDIPSRSVIGPDAGQNKVVMGLWFDNTHGTPVQESISQLKVRSRVTDDFAIKRIAVYRETDCIVPTDIFTFNSASDQLWFVNLAPGAFSWNKNEGNNDNGNPPGQEDEGMPATLNIVANPGAGVIPANGLVYLYVVLDLDPIVIKTDMDSRERYTDVEVGVALNNAAPGVTLPEAFTFQSGVKGPRTLGAGDGAELVHNTLDPPDDIYNWESGDVAESGGQPYIIDALPPEIICQDFGPGSPSWTHADWPISEQTPGADGNEVVDNFDELIVRADINDPGPANLVTTGSNRPRVDMRPFGMSGNSGIYQLMDPDVGTVWKASVNDGSADYIADSDSPAQRTDTSSGQLFIEFRARDDAGNEGSQLCPVNKPVDTRRPDFNGTTPTFDFAPGGDLNGDGVAGIGDIIRITVNMGANWRNWNKPGQTKEIQSVVADLTSWDVLPGQYAPILDKTWDGYVELTDPSGDNQFFSADFTVLQGTHNGEPASVLPAVNPETKMVLTAIDNANNPRVSLDQGFPRILDNQPPIPPTASWTLLNDDPDNNIINIGDVVRFEADLSDPSNDDVEMVELDLFEAGLGGPHQAFLTDPDNNGIYTLDWTVLDPRDNNSQAWDRDEDNKVDVCPVPAVPIGNGERYTINMLITDTTGNTYEAVLGDPAYPHLEGNPGVQVSVDTRVPEPVTNLSAQAMAEGAIELNWDNPTDGTGPDDTKDGPLSFDIYWDQGTGGAADVYLASVFEQTGAGCVEITSWNTDQTVETQNLDCGQLYKFSVIVRDNANNSSERSVETGAVTDCYAPEMCIFEPEPGGLYSAASGLTVFVQPTEDDYTLAENEDVQEVMVRARLQDAGDGPGPWQDVSAWINQSDDQTHFEIELDADGINSLFSSCGEGVVEFIVRTRDFAGNENTDAEAMGDCDPMFWVNWAFSSVDGSIVTINDDFIAPQSRCGDELGYLVEGNTNQVDICAACGTEPYKVKALVGTSTPTFSASVPELDYTTIYYSEGLDSCSSFNLDVTSFQGDLKGANTLMVIWVDATGSVDTAVTMICVEDVVAPCARITNPIDGKCINIAQSMINPVPIDVCLGTIPGEICVDQEDVLKIELQWSTYCCEGEITKDSSFFRWIDCNVDPDTGTFTDLVCDTFPVGAEDFLIDSIVCVDSSSTCSLLVRVDTTFTVPCDEDWTVIDDISGNDLSGNCGHYDWWNTEALAGFESGDVIYLRGVVYDNVGNKFYTPCVQTCLDREAPPMCIWTPDECGTFEGTPKVRGDISIVGELDLTQGQVDDIAWVNLWFKKTTDPDIPSSWVMYPESGFIDPNGGTNSTVWRWEFDTDALDDNESYDFRVIPTTVTDRVAWDADGDGMFDAYTFSADSCDMTTWFIDNVAPQVAIDTAWTDINGTQIAIPTPACSLSDPKGWIWGQYGEPITVQATAYPLGDIDDIWKVRWTLYDDQASCECEGSDALFNPNGSIQEPSGSAKLNGSDANAASAEDYWILGERFGTDWNDFRTMTFNVADYVPVQDGYWSGVLHVELWDSCGNYSEDCVEVFILDSDPTDAIVYLPKNDATVCGEVLLQARSLQGETIDKVTFYYEQDGDTTTIGDGSKVGPEWKNIWEYTWVTDDGNLHPGAFTVWAVATDNALNVQETIWPKTLYLSCAQPTVELTAPAPFDEAEGNFLGACDIEVTATASTPDVIYNPVVNVCFYYHPWLQEFSYDSDNLIGCDEFSTTDQFGVTWNPSDDLPHDGKYYIDAVATNKAGQTMVSDPVLIHFDDASPYAKIIEVDGDGTDGGVNDPTLISVGSLVDIYAFAGDSLARHGVDQYDNCGVDSVIFYVMDGDETVFGTYLMGVDREIDSLFMGQWPTATFAPGDYTIAVRAFDCACHSSYSADWYVRLVGAPPAGTLAIDAPDVCGYPSVVDAACFTFEPADGVVNPTVRLFVSNAISDVYDQYTQLPGNMQYDSDDGLYHWCGDLPSGFDEEGLYMVRADIRTQSGNDTFVADDADGDGQFDDFSFNASKPYHMMVRVDQSVTPFTVSLDNATIQAHNTVEVTVTPDEECDVDEVCYGLVAENGNEAEGNCFSDFVYDLDPLDSGFVSMKDGIWHGQVRVRVTDPLGNTDVGYSADDLWVLDVDETGALVTEPRWGDYVTGTSATVVGRKLTTSDLSDVTFFYGGATGSGTEIAGDVTQSGDEFSVTWDLEDEAVPEGELYLWTSASTDKRVRVIVSKGVTGIVLKDPQPNVTRTVGNQTRMFIGWNVDLCLDRDSLNVATNGVEIDSVVFAYRRGDAPGVPYEPYADEGWVPIAKDQYGSLCVEWDTPYQSDRCSSDDGWYAIAAWVYSRAGTVDHSNIVHAYVDNSDPYTEIVDIDGDETFESCHEVVVPDDVPVKISAVAIDDCLCIGDGPDYEPDNSTDYKGCNSGARYLQFYVSDCNNANLSGEVDIVILIDESGSMGPELNALAGAGYTFLENLTGVNWRIGITTFGDITSCPSQFTSGADRLYFGSDYWSTDGPTIANALAQVAADYQQSDGIEKGLTAMSQTVLGDYSWRPDARKVIILITDEDADENPVDGQCSSSTDASALISAIVGSGATVHTVLGPSSDQQDGYSTLAAQTGGFTYDISQTSNYSSMAAALASRISADSRSGPSAGIVWGEQIDLTDGDQYPNNPYAYWDPSGLPEGTYCVWSEVVDEVGNWYASEPVNVCINDVKAPIGQIAAVQRDYSCCDTSYAIYGRSCDDDIAWVQFQYRLTSSSAQTDWTAIGLASVVNGDPHCWTATWNPCLLSGNYDLRMVPIDQSGNEDFDNQPVLHVSISNCMVTVAGASVTDATVEFEDKNNGDYSSPDNLGLVHVNGAANIECHTMFAVYDGPNADDRTLEKVALWQDVGVPTHWMGSFDDSSILNGGDGWFWVGMTDYVTDPPTTHLTNGHLKVYHVDPDVGFPGTLTNDDLGASISLDPGALDEENGIVLFPVRFPRLSLMQQHIQAWANVTGISATAIRATSHIDADGHCELNPGKYAAITISYDEDAVAAAGLSNEDLTVAWWDTRYGTGVWNFTKDIIADSQIKDGKASFLSEKIHGIYAVISAGRECNSGAVSVDITPFPNGVAGPTPTIRANVRSRIEFANGNDDIDSDGITVMLDGKTMLARGDGDDDAWDWDWSNVTGDLIIWWENNYCGGYWDGDTWYWYSDCGDNYSPSANSLPLSEGEHTLTVQAFNRTGYCSSDEYTFTVDATEPDVIVTGGYQCPNPTFTFRVVDNGAGVNWDSVYIDVYEFTPSEQDQVTRAARLLHTETPDAWLDGDKVGDEVSFSLTFEQSEYDGFRIVIYNGERVLKYDDVYDSQSNGCHCEYYLYDHDASGVPDMVGNHTEVVEEWYTVNSAGCVDPTKVGVDPELNNNPFDPFAGEVANISMGGFAQGGGHVEATVYDLTGERVATLDASGGSVTWDGRTYNGDAVAEGVYLIHLQRVGGSATGNSTSVALKVVVKRAD